MKRNMFRTVCTTVLIFCMSVSAFASQTLIPVGKVVGISLAEGSVTVVAFDDTYGQKAREAGIQIGDEIVAVDSRPVDSAADLHEALKHSDGSVKINLSREGKIRQLNLEPELTEDGPKLGVYIREGVTGIGTVTYYDPNTGKFGALGHGVSDQQGNLAQMRTGNVYRATVSGIKQGKAGNPGQLKGSVSAESVIGELGCNTPFGIFGTCGEFHGEALPVAECSEVQQGHAEILSNISGDAIEVFSVEILKVYDPAKKTGRDMMIQVTDPELLQRTGGIVAGMSGSPIIQDGKLVGAVTHVLVNDPTKGYGIMIENMLSAAE